MVMVELSFEQITQAVQQLPPEEKRALWRMLDPLIDRATIQRQFSEALATIHAAHAPLSETEAQADVTAALQEVRAERHVH